MKRPAALCLVLAIALSGCARTFSAGAAVVNGRSITLEELESEMANAAADPQAGGEDVEAARRALEGLIQQELIVQVAEARDIRVTEQRVSQELEALKAESGSEQVFRERLQQAGLTEQTLRERIRLNVLIEDLGAKVAEPVTDEQLRSLYRQEREQFRQVRARDILFAVDEQTGEDRARLQAEDALADIRGGASFAATARRLSDDPATRDAGGSLGDWHDLAQDEPQFADALWRARLGRPSGPVQDQRGFHVFVVTRKRYQAFEQVRDRLRQELEGRVRQQTLQELLREAVGEADIVVNPRYGDWDSETGRIVPHRSFVPAEPEEPVQLPEPFPGQTGPPEGPPGGEPGEPQPPGG